MLKIYGALLSPFVRKRLALLVTTGFDRPNLSFAVVPCATKEAGHRGIAAALREAASGLRRRTRAIRPVR